MKKMAITLFLTTTLVSSFAFADETNCPKGALHCAYITGLSQTNLHDGRFLKIDAYTQTQHDTYSFCANSSFLIVVTPATAPKALGNDKVIFQICRDRSGTKCQVVAQDNFTVKQSGKNYSASPQFFNVNLSSAKGSYPACDGAVPKSLIVI